MTLQVYMYPATGESPLDENGNAFPVVGMRVPMNAYYRGLELLGTIVRVDPSAFSSVAQPAVYAPLSLGIVTTDLANTPVSRDGQCITTHGYATRNDGGGATWVGSLSGTADGVFTLQAPGTAVWRLKDYGPFSEVDIRSLGVLPDGTDCAGRFQDILDTVYTDAAQGEGRDISIYAPAGASNSYYFSTSLDISYATQHVQFCVRIRGDGYRTIVDAYDSQYWDTPGRTGGTTFKFANGSDGIVMATPYGYSSCDLELTDLCILGGGSGSTVYGIKQSALATEHCQGSLRLKNVFLANWPVAIRGVSYFACLLDNLKIRACYTGLQVGDMDSTYQGGFGPVTCHNIDIQACTRGIEWHNSAQFAIYGGLIQGNTYHHYFKSNSQRGYASIHDVYSEGGTLFYVESGISTIGSFRCYGLFAGDGPSVTLRGNGWRFYHCSLPATYVAGSAYDAIFERCECTVTNDAGSYVIKNRFTRTIASQPYDIGMVSGTVNVDVLTNGSTQIVTLLGNTTLALPNNAPLGCTLKLIVRQDGVGGWTVAFSGSYRASINLTGNVASTDTVLVMTYDDGGHGWIQNNSNIWM